MCGHKLNNHFFYSYIENTLNAKNCVSAEKMEGGQSLEHNEEIFFKLLQTKS